MTQPSAFFRENGTGPAVLCLHANASSSSQWRPLTELLAPRFARAGGRFIRRRQEPGAASRRRVAEGRGRAPRAGARARGRALLARRPFLWRCSCARGRNDVPAEIDALALYEPTLFALVEAESRPPNDVDGIRNAVASAVAALGAGDAAAAARFFIDFWMGSSSFDRMPERNREAIAQAIAQVQGWKGRSSKNRRLSPRSRRCSARCFYSPAALRRFRLAPWRASWRAVLPSVEVVELEGLGHMAPVTHPERVNPRIVQFLGAAPLMNSKNVFDERGAKVRLDDISAEPPGDVTRERPRNASRAWARSSSISRT